MFAMIGFLFRHLKGYRALVGFATLMTITQVGSDILAGFPIKFITDQIQGKAPPEALDQFLAWFDGLAQGNRPTSVILFSIAALLVLSAVSALLSYLQRFLAAFIGQNLTARLRRTLFEHLERLSLDWHGKQKKGDLIQRITGDITNIEKLVTDGLVDLLAGLLTLLGVAAVMALVSLQFTLIALLILPPLALVVFAYTGSIKAAAKMASKATGQVANVATEDIGAITVVKAFTLEEREALRFGRYVHKNHTAGMRAGGLQAQFTPVVMLLGALGTALILGVGASVALGIPFRLGPLEIESRSITVGTLVLFLGYLKMLYQPLRDLSKLTALATMANAGAERIQEVFDQAPEVLEHAGAYTGPIKLRGDISFEQAVFGYTREQPILKGISLSIPAGRKVALVGLSGGGKTTLVKLIPRFYETGWGVVKIDGVDNRLYPLSVLRQNISLVLQESVLFEGTIHDNIAIGKPDATDQEIIAAAQQAHIHDTIMQLPDGYQTTVREQGRNFSGGQRQRLAIARAILRDAPILILDEPTASLDVEAEAEVMRALDRLVNGRTVLMISHRLSTLGNVDEIIVLKDGRIVEQGTFKALKGRGGVFASLLAEQNRYNLERFDHESIIRPAMAMQAFQAQPHALPLVPPWGGVAAPPVLQRPPAPPPSVHLAIPAGTGPEQPPKAKGVAQRAGVVLEPAYLFIEMNGQIVSQRKLDRPTLTIGRSSGSDIEIRSNQVSRLHARIVWENGAWYIEDASSLNGVMYQGRRIDRHALKKGDRVSLSASVIVQYEAHR